MITLKEIRNNKNEKPCENSWAKLLKSYNKTKADDTVVTCEYLLKTLNVSDTLWVIFNCIPNHEVKKRNMMADIAERVLYIWEDWAKDNAPKHFDAPRRAIEATRNGDAASADTADAADAAHAAYAAYASDAAYAAYAAADAAYAYAARAAYAAADAAYAYAASDAYDAYDAYAAADAARASERKAQEQIILKYFK